MKFFLVVLAIFFLVFGAQSASDVCKLPSEVGPCRANMPRYFWNGQQCEKFFYGGCQGNGNNFKTTEECEQACAQ